jgi:exodeoxyribonuclease-3
MKIATLNINSVRPRIVNLCQWIAKEQPDVLFLQEIKCETENFLYFEFESLGYHAAVLGQKSYNGVAILSKLPIEVIEKNLPNFKEDPAARYIEVLVKDKNAPFYAISVYAPNGCSPDKKQEAEKLAYKLQWFDKLYEHLIVLQSKGLPIVIGGDFNVMMQEIDVFDSSHFKGSPLYIPEVKNKISALLYHGFYDAFRTLSPNIEGFTFWDYTANSLVTNSGLRIDYIFITAKLAERLRNCNVDKSLRFTERPSDHTVLLAEFKD